MRLTKRDFLQVYNVIDRNSDHKETELIDDKKWSFELNIVQWIGLYQLDSLQQAAIAVVICNSPRAKDAPYRTSAHSSCFWKKQAEDFAKRNPELTTRNWMHYLSRN